jgi:NAD(P)-dependent dehydrogenase (short-subunit alcohol dehydrogenase family)
MTKSRTILLTGVSRGLGLALTDEFVRLGHTVVGCARTKDRIRELSGRHPAPHRFDVVDVADESQVQKWAERVLSDGMTPDLLLNNAAVINSNSSLWETDGDEFSRVVDVNVKGSFHVIRHFVPTMIVRGSGVIVNFSSGWGRSTSPQVATYCATKWAIEGMTRALADELPYGMAAIPLNPGIIDTEMLRSCFGDSAASYVRPETWAKKAASFLLELGPEDNGDPLTVPGM